MPPAAVQLPYRREEAKPLGPCLFRKQVLPVGAIDYQGRRIEFSKSYLRRLADNFEGRAFDQVPFQLATEANRHNQAPDRFRGEVKGFAVTDDGLDAIVELTEDGAKVVRDNPRLGVSARIVEGKVSDSETPRKLPAIQHVCGTLDPYVAGLRDWEAISDLTHSYPADQVVDLTAATFTEAARMPEDKTLTDEQLKELEKLPADERPQKVTELLGQNPAGAKDGEGGDKSKSEDEEAERLLSSLVDDEEKRGRFRKLFDKLAGNDDDPKDEPKGDPKADGKTEDKEPVALSKAAQESLDLARSEAAAANSRTKDIEQRLAKERLERRRTELTNKGVPPAVIDLAAPVLEQPDEKVIDLSNGEKTSAREVVEKLLGEFEGVIDLSDDYGTAVGDGDPEAEEARKIAKAWGESEAKK